MKESHEEDFYLYFSTEVNYTWVLNPNDVPLEVGLYYLLVRPIVPAGVNSTNMAVFITSFATNCKYWNETDNTWYEDGCRVSYMIICHALAS